jgi:hypothetical protein
LISAITSWSCCDESSDTVAPREPYFAVPVGW